MFFSASMRLTTFHIHTNTDEGSVVRCSPEGHSHKSLRTQPIPVSFSKGDVKVLGKILSRMISYRLTENDPSSVLNYHNVCSTWYFKCIFLQLNYIIWVVYNVFLLTCMPRLDFIRWNWSTSFLWRGLMSWGTNFSCTARPHSRMCACK